MNEAEVPEPVTDPGDIADGAHLEPPVLPPHRLAVPVGLLVATVLVIADQLTKLLAESVLAPGEFVPWLGSGVGWQLVFNPGGAFGIPAPHWLFLLVTVGVVVLVARVLPRTPTLLSATAYGLLLGGAIGNVLDRLFKPGGDGFGTGYVVDFVAWGSFPRFNVADSAITVGFVLLVIALLQEERRAERALLAATGDPVTGDPVTDDPAEDAGRAAAARGAEDAGRAGDGRGAEDATDGRDGRADGDAAGHEPRS